MEFKICNQGRHLIFNQKTYKFNIAMKKYLKKYCSYNPEQETYCFIQENNIPKSDFECKITPLLTEIKQENKIKYVLMAILFIVVSLFTFKTVLVKYKNQEIYKKYTLYNSKSDMIKSIGFPTSISGSKLSDVYFYNLMYHENTCKLVFNVNNDRVIIKTKYNEECAKYFLNKYK